MAAKNAPELEPKTIQAVLATHEEAIRALGKHQLALLLEVKNLYFDFPAYAASLKDEDLDKLRKAVMLEENHREAIRATQEAEHEKEARMEAGDRDDACNFHRKLGDVETLEETEEEENT